MTLQSHILITTRAGGTSSAPFDTLNLGDHVGDDATAVERNRQLLAQQLGARPVFMKQVHGIDCIQIDRATPDGLEADAVVTTDLGVACVMMVADCLPVLFWNESGTAVGAAHAGWRGFVGHVNADGTRVNILQATLDKLFRLSMPAEPIHAWLGACIGFESFEVGVEVAEHFDPAFKREVSHGKWLVDLAGAARQKLFDYGVTTANGNDGKPSWCTVTNDADYFSHRRDAKKFGATGRMAACIWRNKK